MIEGMVGSLLLSFLLIIIAGAGAGAGADIAVVIHRKERLFLPRR